MTQIVALYEPAVGTPWYFVLFLLFLFLLTLALPALIRFVDLRRPVINLWSAILLAFICGLNISVLCNIFAIPQSGQIYLFAASFVYSYWIMHIGYRDYCIKRYTETDMKRQEDRHRRKRSRAIFIGLASSIAIFCVFSFWQRFLGPYIGRQAAIKTVERESLAQNAPTGFMGAKWLMTMSQVKSLIPDATEFAPGNLKLDTTGFGRPAFVDFEFKDNQLLIIIVTFKGEKTESTYRQTHILVENEYGAFPEPSSTSDFILASEKRIGRIMIMHVLYQSLGMPIEQVTLYRTKADTPF